MFPRSACYSALFWRLLKFHPSLFCLHFLLVELDLGELVPGELVPGDLARYQIVLTGGAEIGWRFLLFAPLALLTVKQIKIIITLFC